MRKVGGVQPECSRVVVPENEQSSESTCCLFLFLHERLWLSMRDASQHADWTVRGRGPWAGAVWESHILHSHDSVAICTWAAAAQPKPQLRLTSFFAAQNNTAEFPVGKVSVWHRRTGNNRNTAAFGQACSRHVIYRSKRYICMSFMNAKHK